jgi:predicted transcriptional regulator
MNSQIFQAKMTGKEVRLWRKSLGLRQSDFWGRVFVSQSRGSRHESGERIPRTVECLLRLTYCSENEALENLMRLRKKPDKPQ